MALLFSPEGGIRTGNRGCLQKNALERLSNFGTAFCLFFDHGNEHSIRNKRVQNALVQNLNIPSLLKL
jgi:hypothetical protein